MEAIDIKINRAKIISYMVDLDKERPEVSATIGLFSGNTPISKFSLRTQTYYGDGLTFELPPDMIEPIVEISKQLEIILVRECNKQLKQLPPL